MLNFDEDRFRSIQGGVVALAQPVREAVAGLLDDGADNLFFLGAGGAGVLMLPAAQLLGRRSAFPVKLVHAAEIIAMDDVNLGPGSIVVIPSLSGTTKEAVAVLEFAQGKGAKVIALTGHADTPVAEKADFNFTNFAEDDTSSEMFYLLSLVVVLAILDKRGELGEPGFDAIVSELALLPERADRGQGDLRAARRRAGQALQGRAVPHPHGRRLRVDGGVVLRHLHPRGDAVDPDPSGPRLRLLPRHARAGRERRLRAPLQVRGRGARAGRPRREVRPDRLRQAAGDRPRAASSCPASAPPPAR